MYSPLALRRYSCKSNDTDESPKRNNRLKVALLWGRTLKGSKRQHRRTTGYIRSSKRSLISTSEQNHSPITTTPQTKSERDCFRSMAFLFGWTRSPIRATARNWTECERPRRLGHLGHCRADQFACFPVHGLSACALTASASRAESPGDAIGPRLPASPVPWSGGNAVTPGRARPNSILSTEYKHRRLRRSRFSTAT
jgi:hypothetical protein